MMLVTLMMFFSGGQRKYILKIPKHLTAMIGTSRLPTTGIGKMEEAQSELHVS